MKDPANPTREELLRWAYDRDIAEPMQDWQILITEIGRLQLFIQLADDTQCPKQWFFLNCLYLLVGDTVRVHARLPSTRQEEFDELRKLLSASWDGHWWPLQRWAERSRFLLGHPNTFVYADWCDGGLILRDRAAE